MPRSRARGGAWALVVPLVAGLAGILFATSFVTAHGTELRTVGRDLPGLITDQNRDVATKAEQVKQLQAEVDRLAAAAAPGDATAKTLRAQAAALAPLVGTQPVSGPAVTVSLDDAHRSAASLPKPYGPDDIVVHQQDVQGVVNALWAGGAEAMMIQDQRVISTSAVQCVGNTLLLQGRVYSPPYVITAIGDADRLRASLDRDPSVQIYREWVDAVGLGWDVRQADAVELPAYTGTIALDAATGG
ncbi:MAG: DUF881 domain-containing protein [Lapillicoccus sp.]